MSDNINETKPLKESRVLNDYEKFDLVLKHIDTLKVTENIKNLCA